MKRSKKQTCNCGDCEFMEIINVYDNREEDWYCEKQKEMIEYRVEFMTEPFTPDWCPLSNTQTAEYSFDTLLDECKVQKPKLKKSPDPRTEHQIQSAFINLCYKARAKYPCLEWIHAIPNGGARDQIVGKKLKDEGVKSGVLDIFLPVPNTKYHGLYIEFKAGRNTLSFEQIRFKAFVESQGYLVGVFYNEGKAFDFLVKYLEER